MNRKNLRAPVLLDHQRVWRTYTGGSRLNRILKQECGDHFPEEWIMSMTEARNAGRQQLREGLSMLKEKPELSLRELVDSDPEYFLGRTAENSDDLCKKDGLDRTGAGVLVKLIDAAERLTVQVHPDKNKAQLLFHSPYGKTECWYILNDGEEGEEQPCVYLGFQKGITREHWMELFHRQDIEGMLGLMHRFEVKKGDMILVQGGVPHAIGANCFLAEIQEPTDYTIRIERVTPAGFAVADELCHQGLGFEKMFDCFSYEGLSREEVQQRWFLSPVKLDGSRTKLIGKPETALFSLYEITVEDQYELDCGSSYCGLYVLEGTGKIECGDEIIPVSAPEQIFVPAALPRLTLSAAYGSKLRLLQFFGP